MSSSTARPAGRSAGYTANMNGVAAVDRALAIARALERARQPLTLSELAAATGLYPSAVLRLAVSLDKCGLVVRRRDQRFMLGPFALQVGKAYQAMLPVEQLLQPVMQDLVRDGMESPSYHVRADESKRLCVLRLDSNHATLDRVRVGDYLPLDRGAAGRILTRGVPAQPVGSGLELLAVSLGERDPSCAAVAGPIFGPGQELLGSLSLSGPMERFNETTIAAMKPVLLAVCEQITRELGGQWPVRGA